MTDDRTDFGSVLKRARERRGVSLQQVAATTKISARVLDALERNDPSKLPGGIFSRAFVRAYAKEVGLDPEETVTQFVAAFPQDPEEAAPPTLATRTVDAEGFESRRRTAVTVFQILGLSIVVIVAVAIYLNVRTKAPAQPAPVPPPPAAGRSATDAPAVQPPAAVPAEAPVPGPTSAPEGSSPLTAAGPGAQVPPAPGTVSPSASAPAVQPPAQAAAPASASALSIVIQADAECWLSLTVDGTKVVARNLQAGERVQYNADRQVVLNTGNAGALTLLVNGKPARSLGGRGEVVTKTITPESAKTLIQ